MYLLSTLVIISALARAAQEAQVPPAPEQVRQTVERSLVFLEKSGTGWWNERKCASCHHVPISIWGLTEAKQRGFAVDDQALDQLRSWAIDPYAKHPKLKPVAQDGNEGTSLNTIYLFVAAASAAPLDEKTAEALKKFTAHLIATQEADGCWKAKGKFPPIEDESDVRTMQSLLVLAAAQELGLVEDSWAQARDRALTWLQKNARSDSNQSLVLQVLVARRFERPDEVQALVKQLLEQQNADGGWSQTKDRPSDALATGQTLYGLTLAGVAAQQPALQRAQGFLVRTQVKDGSWLVPIRSQRNTGKALSHYGSGWAVIGLLRTLPGGQQVQTGASSGLPAKAATKLLEATK